MSPSQINDSIPTEEEVGWAVRRLQGHRLGGPSHMCAEHLQEWLRDHRAADTAAEPNPEAEGETLGPEGRERYIKDGLEDRWEEKEPTK